ncbi:hypothetical protein CC80DRAFT_179483 [Byssothecium circinans]|uniref:Uncharacterized protein n=1 Tax=Byssothecium circinans TaxID=147558 RepID=A0A6A5TNH5_9PLEO|nr:hypothetical protein CC80DRAFT_179483 [Byssothecium circinans]
MPMKFFFSFSSSINGLYASLYICLLALRMLVGSHYSSFAQVESEQLGQSHKRCFKLERGVQQGGRGMGNASLQWFPRLYRTWCSL